MNKRMTRKEFDSLPKRSELTGNPLPNQLYRDDMGGVVEPIFNNKYNQLPNQWWAFSVSFIEDVSFPPKLKGT